MLTLPGPASTELEIKRSRFVAHASRVDDLAGTLAFFERVADLQATHNCWAWRVDGQYRFNDDGEPGGTAGRPILAAIEGKGLDHVMVIVTRYFGGIKLGAGGLVRAYGGAAARCLDSAGVMEVEPQVDCVIEADFEWTGQVHALLTAHGGERLSEDFDNVGLRIRLRLAESSYPGLCTALRDATRGTARISRLG